MVLSHNTLVIVLALLSLLNEMLLRHIGIHHLLFFLLLIKHPLLFNLHLLPHEHLLLHALLLLPLLLRHLHFLLLALLLGPPLFLLRLFHFCSLLHFCCFLCISLCLGLGRGDSCSLCVVLLLLLRWLVPFTFTFADLAKDFRDIWLCVDAGGGCAEHLLEPKVCLVGLLTGEDHTWLDINLLLHHHLRERNKLNKECKLALLILKTLGIELLALEQSNAKIGLLHGRRVDVMKITEGRLAQQLLRHLRLLEQLLIHLSLKRTKNV